MKEIDLTKGTIFKKRLKLKRDKAVTANTLLLKDFFMPEPPIFILKFIYNNRWGRLFVIKN